MKKSPERSPAFVLVEHVWKHAPQRSWRHLNRTMQQALALAIESGLRFDVGDIEAIHTEMRGGYWFGENEWIHGLAVEWNNTPAAVSFEAWVCRKPFVLDGKRLFVGALVDTKYLDVPCRCGSVTSFTSDDSVVICTYGDEPRPVGKPTHRITVARSKIRDMERARKAA